MRNTTSNAMLAAVRADKERLREINADLLAALKEIGELDVHHKDEDGTWTDVGKIARAAIAKAEGAS